MFRKNFLLIVLVFSGSTLLAQQPRAIAPFAAKSPQLSTPVDTKLYMSPAIAAEYPGGDVAWKKYLNENVDRSVAVKAKAPAGQYMVMLRCIISNTGVINDVSPESHFGYGMEQEAIRVIKKSPRWVPARNNGRPVNAIRKVCVTFSVPAD